MAFALAAVLAVAGSVWRAVAAILRRPERTPAAGALHVHDPDSDHRRVPGVRRRTRGRSNGDSDLHAAGAPDHGRPHPHHPSHRGLGGRRGTVGCRGRHPRRADHRHAVGNHPVLRRAGGHQVRVCVGHPTPGSSRWPVDRERHRLHRGHHHQVTTIPTTPPTTPPTTRRPRWSDHDRHDGGDSPTTPPSTASQQRASTPCPPRWRHRRRRWRWSRSVDHCSSSSPALDVSATTPRPDCGLPEREPPLEPVSEGCVKACWSWRGRCGSIRHNQQTESLPDQSHVQRPCRPIERMAGRHRPFCWRVRDAPPVHYGPRGASSGQLRAVDMEMSHTVRRCPVCTR